MDIFDTSYDIASDPKQNEIDSAINNATGLEFELIGSEEGERIEPGVDGGSEIDSNISFARSNQSENDDNDIIDGQGGDDIILGLSGNDTLLGGDGNDTIEGGTGRDLILGQDGNDSLFGGRGKDTIDSGAGNDIIDGNDGNDLLSGGDGDDTLLGSRGDDFMIGGAGDDTLIGGKGSDTLDGGSGKNILDGIADGTKDRFIIRADGFASITNFEQGIDTVNLADGLTFFDVETRDISDNQFGIVLKDTDTFIAVITATEPIT